MNDIQSKIKDTTRKMMAIVSELSMNQASAMKLQATVKEQEADLEQVGYVSMTICRDELRLILSDSPECAFMFLDYA